MDVVWHKVRRDLADNKARTALAVLSTAVGVLALGLVLSFAIVLKARLFSDQIGQVLLNMPLDFLYAAGGMALWLGIVVVLSVLASLSPALRAGRMSVRETLAYE